MINLSAEEIQKIIEEKIPHGSVIEDHDENGHFYKIMTPDEDGVVGKRYKSVTGRIQILKDESLINYKMNQSLNYVFANFKNFNDSNIMEHLEAASRVSQNNLTAAGDIGKEVHDARQLIFNDWIKNKKRPDDFLSYIPAGQGDVRIVSALRALDSFCSDYLYVPISCEKHVYSHKLKLAGKLDDIGMMHWPINKVNNECKHIRTGTKNIVSCTECGSRWSPKFSLIDIKTSNAFKDHYFFQVALYYVMFYNLTGLLPRKSFILKLSKENGTYEIEDLKRPAKLASYARSMIRTNDGIEYIKKLRKDNLKVIGEKIDL